jgi:hypothetical protein
VLSIRDVDEENLDDLFKVCSIAYSIGTNIEDNLLYYNNGKHIRSQWILGMNESIGCCVKIAYLNSKPVSQIMFCPETEIPFIVNPRNNTIQILCLYNPFPETQRKGVASALLKNLIQDCREGRYFKGESCEMIVTAPFPTMGRQALLKLYKKLGFNHGFKEMYLEINGNYSPRENPDYHYLPGDENQINIFYNPSCEWGFFFAKTSETLIRKIDLSHRINIFNTWENPNELITRSVQRVTAGRTFINGKRIAAHFWSNREGYIKEIKDVLKPKD